MSEAKPSKYDWTEFVREKWKYFWMNQKQNDQRDYENYYRRAFGVDANMLHHLGELIEKEHNRLLDAANAEIKDLKQTLSESCAGRDQWRKTHLELATANALLDKALKLILVAIEIREGKIISAGGKMKWVNAAREMVKEIKQARGEG